MSDGHVIHEPGGTITLGAPLLAHVVRRAAEEGDGVRVRRPRRGLEVTVSDGAARVELELAVRYGLVLPEVAGAAQERVAAALRDLCGLDPRRIDVSVEELDR